ncbi:ThiF family adenylyltransferase [Pseudomonas sp. MF6776]|uniref:ThiF family adenylyltransferase n=1 Tax=Pseudomonas sp. MF6776 TaxID=2797534 RepID=UPI00190CABF1|nr:ThiF family adenylyltransferase [Pseudomonas sp. MF6776]MBK3468183.1 ThiF family adenylyltransferase [Pseudomonas sp. MF6776]
MSQSVISRSPDLLRLRNEGLEVEVRSGFLMVHSVPYLNAQGAVERGTLCCPLTLASPDQTAKPSDHLMHFIGGFPHKLNGGPITAIEHSAGHMPLADGIVANYSFSNKPRDPAGFENFYEKVWSYLRVIWYEVRSKGSGETPCTFKTVDSVDPDSVFVYEDTASARAGIGALAAKLSLLRIAIIGLGGTGSFVLDSIAKTSVREIHLYDDDEYQQHNAYRSPGATSRAKLDRHLSKVDFYQESYSVMHKGIVAHNQKVTESNVDDLRGFDYIFVCVDKGLVRRLIYDRLGDSNARLIDTGMDVQATDEGSLWGSLRVTTSTPASREHVFSRIPMGDAQKENLYVSNVQVVELNALNAMLAVIKFKQLCGFYHEDGGGLNASFNTATNKITNSEPQS